MSVPFDMKAAFAPYHIARRLPLTFDSERLSRDLTGVDEAWWGSHEGPYHDGNWESVSLWAPGGDRQQQRSFGAPFAATEVLDLCPYFAEVMAAFPCEKNRVRLMRLRPGGHILRHSDPIHQISDHLLRVHVPIVTSDDVHFHVNDQRIAMRPGEVWHVDVRFPHEVHNAGIHPRVHLVLDLMGNAETDALLAGAASSGQGRLTEYFFGQLRQVRKGEGG